MYFYLYSVILHLHHQPSVSGYFTSTISPKDQILQFNPCALTSAGGGHTSQKQQYTRVMLQSFMAQYKYIIFQLNVSWGNSLLEQGRSSTIIAVKCSRPTT